ncbi:GYF domain [Musa troglodytarum]|uniref:GYF domain n=1 Tax=Musa troglodytarum TaxID=320322 RepID=A0A9E7JLT1_9LILI|nr:GYF domain [Musa troglodytarum]
MADLSNADGRRELTVDPPPHPTVKGCASASASASANRPETLAPSRVFVLGRPCSLYLGIKLLIVRLEMMLSSFRVSLFVYVGLLFECFFLIGNMQGSENSIPLSPQWLISKAVDKELSSHHDNRPDAVKALGAGEDLSNTGKRNDVFRPVLHNLEPGRQDRWHDEERETSSAIRRDRWKEGDKEPGDARRIERWFENTFRHSGETRRTPSERWNDSGNKESDQRRESKWNTRWGPGDKESDSWREKWSDSGKGGNGTPDKGAPASYLSGHGKDINNHGKETEGEDHYSRSWRSNYTLGRGRGDSSHHQLQTPVKQPNMIGYGRIRAENGISSAPIGRGRFNSSMGSTNSDASRSLHLGFSHEKSDGASGDLSTIRYARMKLLDIYRTTDIKGFRLSLDEFVEVPSLTQVEPLEPLAFSAPTSDESVIIKGIDKGEIVSSGASQLIKESSIGRTNTDAVSSRQNVDVVLPSADEMITKEVTRMESSSHCVVPQKSQSAGDHKYGSKFDRKDFSLEVASVESDMSSSHLQKDMEFKHNTAITSLLYRDGQWQDIDTVGFHLDTKSDSNNKRQSTEVMKESESLISKDVLISRKLLSPSPEDLSLYYKDPQGQIQGPFSGSDLIGWFEAGYFGIDLQVRLAGSPADAPFSSLGDVMPHLRMKAGPPPGFGVVKHSVTLDESLKGKIVNPGSIHSGLGENVIKSGQRNTHDTATESQNRFLESLMSGNMNGSPSDGFSLSRGMQEFGGSTSGRLPSVVGESGSDMNYLLAQARLLERQRSLLNPLSYWSEGDISSIASKPDMISDSSMPHSKFMPSAGGSPPQILQSPQHVDLLSLLHAGADKPPSRSVNSGVPFRPNFLEAPTVNSPICGGVEFPADMLNMHYNQPIPSQIRFGVQQQGLQSANQPPLPHLITQHGDLSSCLVPPEKMLTSEINQDPRLSNLLQQQHLLSQLQLHSQIPPVQLPSLEKILLLQQQQKQEQQQFLMLQQQQQQHMLSKVLSSHQSHQQFGDPSYGQAPAAMSAGNAAVNHLMLQGTHEALQINQQRPVAYECTEQPSYYPNVNMQGTLDVNSVSSGPLSLCKPHQVFDQMSCSKESDTQFTLDNDDIPNPATVEKPLMADSLTFLEAMKKSEELTSDLKRVDESLGDAETDHKPPSISQTQVVPPFGSETLNSLDSVEGSHISHDFVSSISDQVQNINICSQEVKEIAAEAQVKKVSEKKLKKQKKSKTKISADPGKGLPKMVSSQRSSTDIEIVGTNANEVKSEVQADAEESLCGPSFGTGVEGSVASSTEHSESLRSQLLSSVKLVTAESKTEGEAESGVVGPLTSNSKVSSSQWAWKSSPGLKPKSLLEIQQEEQLRAQKETLLSEIDAVATSARSALPAPWSGLITNLENKLNGDTKQAATSSVVNSENNLKSKSRKSQLHDLLAEEVLTKSSKEDAELFVSRAEGLLLPPPTPAGSDIDTSAVDDDDFVEAKDTRKARKKASKSKASGVKIPQSVGMAELSADPSPTEKAKSTCLAQQEKELLPALPKGPSLGDFVLWKGDQVSSAPPPAWSLDSRKLHRPMSLRDIQMEQEKRSGTVQQQISIPTPAKLQSNHASRGNGSSRQVSGSVPSNIASSIHLVSQVSTQTKSRSEDDLFWGPSDQSKPEPKKSGFPPSQSSVSWGVKGTPSKGASGAGSGQKPSGSRPVDQSLSASPGPVVSVSKGRSVPTTKNSEAVEFRDWCVNEWFRLTGTNDTSFLEFCIKQSTSEAEVLLRENIGSLDRNHEFIDNFLNYKEFLAPDVLETAFQSQKSRNTSEQNTSLRSSNTATDAEEGLEDGLDGPSKGRGKKKGKKGQKVNPSILGFNVVSNRIMKGEIQSIED